MEMGFTVYEGTDKGNVIWDSEFINNGGTDYQTVGTIVQNLISAYNSASTSNPGTFTLSTQDFL